MPTSMLEKSLNVVVLVGKALMLAILVMWLFGFPVRPAY